MRLWYRDCSVEHVGTVRDHTVAGCQKVHYALAAALWRTPRCGVWRSDEVHSLNWIPVVLQICTRFALLQMDSLVLERISSRQRLRLSATARVSTRAAYVAGIAAPCISL
jgi:hypothetical protein